MLDEEKKHLISLYIDNQLDSDKKAEVEKLIEESAECRQYYDDLKALAEQADNFMLDSDSEFWSEQKDSILERIDKADDSKIVDVKKHNKTMIYRTLAVAASVVLVAVISVYEIKDIEKFDSLQDLGKKTTAEQRQTFQTIQPPGKDAVDKGNIVDDDVESSAEGIKKDDIGSGAADEKDAPVKEIQIERRDKAPAPAKEEEIQETQPETVRERKSMVSEEAPLQPEYEPITETVESETAIDLDVPAKQAPTPEPEVNYKPTEFDALKIDVSQALKSQIGSLTEKESKLIEPMIGETKSSSDTQKQFTGVILTKDRIKAIDPVNIDDLMKNVIDTLYTTGGETLIRGGEGGKASWIFRNRGFKIESMDYVNLPKDSSIQQIMEEIKFVMHVSRKDEVAYMANESITDIEKWQRPIEGISDSQLINAKTDSDFLKYWLSQIDTLETRIENMIPIPVTKRETNPSKRHYSPSLQRTYLYYYADALFNAAILTPKSESIKQHIDKLDKLHDQADSTLVEKITKYKSEIEFKRK